jgi:hypothetical protein
MQPLRGANVTVKWSSGLKEGSAVLVKYSTSLVIIAVAVAVAVAVLVTVAGRSRSRRSRSQRHRSHTNKVHRIDISGCLPRDSGDGIV